MRLYAAALTRDGLALKFVTEYDKTGELCMIAVRENGLALNYVPEYLKWTEICLAAFDNDVRALRYFPDHEMINGEMFMTAARDYGLSLKFVPERFKTAAVCYAAVQNTGAAYIYVPEHEKSLDLCLVAIVSDKVALEDIPDNHNDENFRAIILDAAVRLYGTDLIYVPRFFAKNRDRIMATFDRHQYDV